MMMTLEPLSFT